MTGRCNYCGNEIWESRRAKYCSRKCSQAAYKEREKARPARKLLTYEIAVCEMCRNEFRRPITRNLPRKTCSTKCACALRTAGGKTGQGLTSLQACHNYARANDMPIELALKLWGLA